MCISHRLSPPCLCWCHDPAESPQLQGSEFSRNSKALDPSTRTTPGWRLTVGDVGLAGESGSCVFLGLENEPLEGGVYTPGKLTWISQKWGALDKISNDMGHFLASMLNGPGCVSYRKRWIIPCFVMSPKELWNKPRPETVVSWEFFCADHLPWNQDWIQAFQPKALVNHIWNWFDIVESRKMSWKLTFPMEIDGWKMKFLLKMAHFQGTC